MKLNANKKITVANGSTGADPESDPADVTRAEILSVNSQSVASDRSSLKNLIFAFSGPAGETITFDLWAIDIDTLPEDMDPDANTKFFRVAAAVVVTANILKDVPMPSPAWGPLYVEVTAETIGADRDLHVLESESIG